MTRSPPWNEAELEALVRLYSTMLAFVKLGAPYNKAQMIREAQVFNGAHQQLAGRSRGSIEAKLMNTTAAVEQLGRPDLSMSDHGYRPLPNMQKALFEAVSEWVKRVPVEADRAAS